MPFSSFTYLLLFLPAAVLITAAARARWGRVGAQVSVLGFSLLFYAHSSASNLPYLIGSILFNWKVGQWIGASQDLRRKRFLQLGLIGNIGFLSVIKYSNFVFANIPYLAHHGIHAPQLRFPLGISFFTIAQIMYLVDCYEEIAEPSSLFDHSTFASFFPYVISGPISQAKRIIHQFPEMADWSEDHSAAISRGLYLFSLGLFKKVVFADAFATAADFGYSVHGHLSVVEAWAFTTCYAMQIYFDFSGYSDMAIGSALMLNIQLPPNFDRPLRAKSIMEFWQRWHISLTEFITSYLYTPILGGFSKATLATSAFATILAMSIAGLWHGPSWTFVIFGLIHGAGLALNQYWRRKKLPKVPAFPSWLLTMMVVDLGFVFFRSATLRDAVHYLPHLVDPRNGFSMANIALMNGTGVRKLILEATQVVGVVAAFWGKSSEAQARNFQVSYRTSAIAISLTLIAFVFLNSNLAKPFVYFAF